MRNIYLVAAFLVASCSSCATLEETASLAISPPPLLPTMGHITGEVYATDLNGIRTISLNGDTNEKNMKMIIRLIESARTDDSIRFTLLEINSLGGSVSDGLLLSKAIERTSKRVVCVVDGEADSMGYYILQSCDLRYMTKRSMLMIHWPHFFLKEFQGEQVDFQNYANRLSAMQTGMIEHMAKKTTLTPAQLAKHLDGGRQWWMSWEEAVRIHAVDGVVDSLNAARLKALKAK